MTTPARFDLVLNDTAVSRYISEPALIEFIRLLTPLTGKIVLGPISCLGALSSDNVCLDLDLRSPEKEIFRRKILCYDMKKLKKKKAEAGQDQLTPEEVEKRL